MVVVEVRLELWGYLCCRPKNLPQFKLPSGCFAPPSVEDPPQGYVRGFRKGYRVACSLHDVVRCNVTCRLAYTAGRFVHTSCGSMCVALSLKVCIAMFLFF